MTSAWVWHRSKLKVAGTGLLSAALIFAGSAMGVAPVAHADTTDTTTATPAQVLSPAFVADDGSIKEWSYETPTPAPSATDLATPGSEAPDLIEPDSGDNALPEAGKSNPDGYRVDFAYHFKMKSNAKKVCIDPFSGYYGDHKTNPKTLQYFNLFKEVTGGAITQSRGIAYFGLDGKAKVFCWHTDLNAGAEYKVGWEEITYPPNSGDNHSHITYTEKYES